MGADLYDDPCPFQHDNIDRLFGVPPMEIKDLPQTCFCGKKITYAETVVFLQHRMTLESSDDTVRIEEVEIPLVKKVIE